MPQTVIKLKYTTARRICKAIFRQAPRAAVFPDGRGGRAPPRASCFAKHSERLSVRSHTIGFRRFRLPGNFNNRNGKSAGRCLRIGARISGAFGKKKSPTRFCKRFAQADARQAGTRSLETHAAPVIRDVRPPPCTSASRSEPGRNELHMIPGTFRPDAQGSAAFSRRARTARYFRRKFKISA